MEGVRAGLLCAFEGARDLSLYAFRTTWSRLKFGETHTLVPTTGRLRRAPEARDRIRGPNTEERFDL